MGKDGAERPVPYSLRALSPTEKQNSRIHVEALAIVWGVMKYHEYLYARHLTLRSDHKPLVSIFRPKKGLPILQQVDYKDMPYFYQDVILTLNT